MMNVCKSNNNNILRTIKRIIQFPAQALIILLRRETFYTCSKIKRPKRFKAITPIYLFILNF